MSLLEKTAGLEEVAEAIGRRPSWLKRHWLKLALEEGFPRKLPGGWRWPRAALEAFLAAGAPAPLPAAANQNGGDYVSAYAGLMTQHYGGQA